MKFITVLVAALLPLAALAAPVANAEPVAEPMPEPVEVAEPDVPGTSAIDSRDVLKRATEYCYIIGNDGNVACRSGPGTGYPVVVRMVPGNGYYFTCYKTGTVVGGNNSWDYSRTYGCYVSGYYTDSSCTKAKLGLC